MEVKFHSSRLENICYGRERDNLHPDLIRKYQRRIQFFMKAVSLVDISKHP
uniref:Endoribonuclease n=1 Tax=Podoviridae sp. cttxo15 TaxID=2826584 RepID=A0A8S5N1L4_9CAUD|nr:MAG TPA: endoribonuclease [Podoviridae sp. cttxo15]